MKSILRIFLVAFLFLFNVMSANVIKDKKPHSLPTERQIRVLRHALEVATFPLTQKQLREEVGLTFGVGQSGNIYKEGVVISFIGLTEQNESGEYYCLRLVLGADEDSVKKGMGYPLVLSASIVFKSKFAGWMIQHLEPFEAETLDDLRRKLRKEGSTPLQWGEEFVANLEESERLFGRH
jgi:hypothetical protein